jgi:endo-1,4-beta-xylanase
MDRDRFFRNDRTHKRRNLVVGATAVGLAVAMAVVLIGTGVGQNIGPSEQVNLLHGQWKYMPGVQVAGDGLHVQHRDFKIVEQDGSGGQENPPVNVLGTHLKATGGFAVSATLKDVQGPASFRLYNAPPQPSDEFVVVPAGPEVVINNGTATLSEWDGKGQNDLANQHASAHQDFAMPVSHDNGATTIKLTDTNGQVSLDVNGTTVGQMPDHNMFNTGAVYIGADAEGANGSFTISQMTAQGIDDGNVTTVDPTSAPAVAKKQDGLQQLVHNIRPDVLVGTNVAAWPQTDPAFTNELYGGDFGIETPENPMKWEETESEPNVFDYNEADGVVDMAIKNHEKPRGHALVFSESLPAWVRNLPTDTQAQKDYVKKVMMDHIVSEVMHFKGRVSEWDVDNEPVADYNDDGSFTATYRDNVFLRAMGPEYLKIALETAHGADPDATLMVNDYGNETDTGPRWNVTFDMMKGLRAEGMRLKYGFESHIYDPSTDNIVDDNGQAAVLNDHMNQLGAEGIDSDISELDAPVQDDNYGNSSQSKQIVGVVNTCLKNKYCKRISFWSFGPLDIFQDRQGDGKWALQTGNDSLFNQHMQPNSSYAALVDDLKKLGGK